MKSLTIATDGLLERGEDAALCIAVNGLLYTATVEIIDEDRPPVGGGPGPYYPSRRTRKTKPDHAAVIYAQRQREDSEMVAILVGFLTAVE